MAYLPERGQRVAANAAMPSKTEAPLPPVQACPICGGRSVVPLEIDIDHPNSTGAVKLCANPWHAARGAPLYLEQVPESLSPMDAWMRRVIMGHADIIAAELTGRLKQAGVLHEDLHLTWDNDPVAPEAEPVPSREERLERALLDVLHQFHERGHPGYQAIRTGWVRVAKLDEWHKALER